jgi:xylulose-5-phosphate/fructose-6-phosphate phosphoketolase
MLPDSLLELRVRPDPINALTPKEKEALSLFQRVGNYMAAAMIYLRDNALLEEELKAEDIKHHLLGHWGTCPGLTLIYGHLNLLINKHDLDMILIVGPGHGAPSILSCLWLEDSLHAFYPALPRNKQGATKLITGFSTPSGFPSHVGAQFPGSIHEGGELGYALAVAYGAVMDYPDLIVTVVVGDGEAETGPTATAWHAHKYLDPAESGAVLPILHANGYKIAERTIFGTMDDKEITSLFTGYGYQVCIVEDLNNLDSELFASLQWAIHEIRTIQAAARSGQPFVKPRWPIIILRTPKGMTGPRSYHGEPVEGSWRSHGVPLKSPVQDKEQFALLNDWLHKYKPRELFNQDGRPPIEIDEVLLPKEEKRMGRRKVTYDAYKPLDLPDWKRFGQQKGTDISEMMIVGQYLTEVFKRNPHTIRLWSPDELTSNKIDAVLDITSRNFQWDPDMRAKGGRVIEILSEHTCQGMMQGYTMTGRTGLFPSYESFLGIVQTMMVQYSKFSKMARETPWRKDIGSLNYIETSTWTRQEHNGVTFLRYQVQEYAHLQLF